MKAPRGHLNKKRILDAALRLADASGAEALSMRNIAEELGVKAMSLYNHVSNKEELLDGLVERVIEEIDPPDINAEWKQAMRYRAKSAHRALSRHPWAILILLTRSNAGPVMLRYVDATLGCLRKAGFSYEIADHAWNAMDNHIYGYTLQEVNFPFEESGYSQAAQEFLPRIPKAEYPYFTELATLIVEKRYSGVHSLEFGLDLILDGLERYRDAGKGNSTRMRFDKQD